MTWTAPETYIAETVLYASQLNIALRDNMLETEAAIAEKRGGLFTQNDGSARATVSYPLQATADIPNINFTGKLSDDNFRVAAPFVTVPRAETYLVYYAARQHVTGGSGRVFIEPYVVGTGFNISNLKMYTNSSLGYRGSAYAVFELSSVSDLTLAEYTFGLAYGVTSVGTYGQWAQRTLGVLPIGPVPL